MGEALRAVGIEVRGESEPLTPDERVRLALQLAERAIQFFMSTHAVGRSEALRRIRASRNAGRTPSRCLDAE
ncbi:MAG TPA: hypothetical protein VMS56_15540 [Thermoanaerobaculia bacterium]|nr:hypothetical protein [Thermoanaerobaculia bacterium]